MFYANRSCDKIWIIYFRNSITFSIYYNQGIRHWICLIKVSIQDYYTLLRSKVYIWEICNINGFWQFVKVWRSKVKKYWKGNSILDILCLAWTYFASTEFLKVVRHPVLLTPIKGFETHENFSRIFIFSIRNFLIKCRVEKRQCRK